MSGSQEEARSGEVGGRLGSCQEVRRRPGQEKLEGGQVHVRRSGGGQVRRSWRAARFMSRGQEEARSGEVGGKKRGVTARCPAGIVEGHDEAPGIGVLTRATRENTKNK